MKTVKALMGFAGIVLLAFMLAGCEEAEKKSSELGKAPKKTLDRAKQKVEDIEKKMADRMKQSQ